METDGRRYLVRFSDGGAGMRHYAEPLEVGAEIADGGDRYRIARVEESKTAGGFSQAWAELETGKAM